jgi:hypothetical protein
LDRLTEAAVLIILGAISVAFGATSALAATKFPMHRSRLERWGGDLVIAGVALLGFSFPMT